MLDANAIGLRPVDETRFAVVDIETTGLIPGSDRIVEIAVVQVEPGCKPKMVLETLVQPSRPMAASDIHGLEDADVASAPTFRDIAGDLVDTLSGCCLVAYNASFDLRMLHWELRQVGIDSILPHLCLMDLRVVLGLGARCSLEAACRAHGIAFHGGHFAAFDALSEAELLAALLPRLAEHKILQLGHLIRPPNRKYHESLVRPPLGSATDLGLTVQGRLHPRPRQDAQVPDSRDALGRYSDALQAALADGAISDDECETLANLRQRYGLRPEQVRGLHAKVFALYLSIAADDEWMSDQECEHLRRLAECLRLLGWTPGD